MNRKISPLFILLAIVLLASIGLNVYFALKVDKLNQKVNSFIPAAMELENENKRLQEKERSQQEQLDDCAFTKDSLQRAALKPSLPNQLPPTDPDQQNVSVQPNLQLATGGSFKDLNKGIQ